MLTSWGLYEIKFSVCLCGRRANFLEGFQQLATHFALEQWLYSSTDKHKRAKEVSECWQTVQVNYGHNAQLAVCTIRKILAADNAIQMRSCWRHWITNIFFRLCLLNLWPVTAMCIMPLTALEACICWEGWDSSKPSQSITSHFLTCCTYLATVTLIGSRHST